MPDELLVWADMVGAEAKFVEPGCLKCDGSGKERICL